MRIVVIDQEAGIFFDKCDWDNLSAYEAMAELKDMIPKNRLKFDYDVMGWFIDLFSRHNNGLLDKLQNLVKKYDQSKIDQLDWEWDMKALKSRKRNDIYKWLYKQDHPKVKIKKQKRRVEIII